MKCTSCGRDIADNSIFCNWCGVKQLREKKRGISVPKARQLPSGKWFIQLRIGGRSISITEPTEAECIAKAREIKAGAQAEPKKPAAITLYQALDDYIKSRSNTLSPSTIRGYCAIRDNRFRPYRDRNIREMQPADWQRMINDEAVDVSPKTLKNAWLLVKTVLDLHDVPVKSVSLPQVVKADRPWLTPEQIPLFVAAAKGMPGEIAALLGLHSCRRSEMMAVTAQDVDLEHGVIHIRGAVVYGDDHRPVKKSTNKNTASRRDVPIMIPALTDALKQRLSEISQADPVIPVIWPNSLLKQINRICDAADLPHTGVHGLRHSFASLGYHLGMSELEVQQIGGWSNSETVHSIYTHLSASDRLRAEQKMKDFYREIH